MWRKTKSGMTLFIEILVESCLKNRRITGLQPYICALDFEFTHFEGPLSLLPHYYRKLVPYLFSGWSTCYIFSCSKF
jgi:hypothetical protein